MISVKNVSKCYRVFDDQRSRLLNTLWPKHTKGMQENWALKDISFEIKRGESVAIIGRNGGGKSTLLEILTGTLTPTSGEVKVNGRVSALLELGSGFNPEYSGRDNVILNGLLLGLSKEAILSRFGEIEAFAEIGVAIDRPVKTYSSGMMMRLAFAVQVLCDPDILIIDEALSVGDFFFQQKCMRYIRGLCDKGVTLLFVSHDTGAVRDLCHRAIFLQRGRLAWDGDAHAAIQHYLVEGMHKQVLNETRHGDRSGAETESHWQDPLWVNPAPVGVGTELLAVCLTDRQGMAINTTEIGGEVMLQVWYRAASDLPVHITATIKNRHDQVVNVSGSYPLRLEMPASSHGTILAFQMSLKVNLESGKYSFKINLGEIRDSLNQGVVLAETPDLGPLTVTWDYGAFIPAFYGMFGLPCEATLPQSYPLKTTDPAN